MAPVIAAIFQEMSTWQLAVAWSAGYVALQFAERWAFRDILKPADLTSRRALVFLATILVSNISFAAFGLIEAYNGGTWGILAAGLLWSGALLNSALVSGSSQQALATAVAPPVLLFGTLPFFIVEAGGSLDAGLAILAGGLLNGIAVFAIWAGSRRLLVSAARERESARIALLDIDTGLPNRQAAERRVAERQRTFPDRRVIAAAIAINRFEHLHGAIGHGLMVALLREVAHRVATAHPAADVARLTARIIGAVWTAGDLEEARDALLRIQQAMKAPIMLGDYAVDVTVTIGLSDAADRSEAVPGADVRPLDRAMIAVDQAHAARVPIARFDPSLYGNPASNLSLMSDMLQALGNGQMSVHYQPQYDLGTGTVVAAEALIRWNHPLRGIIPPVQFVPMAEETGDIAAMTEWVLAQAIRDQRALAERGHSLAISVNFSGRLIADAEFATRVIDLAAGACGKLCLEVTETAIIGDPYVAAQTLQAFRTAGLSISIDDYGAGLSSLAYLKTIPADELKIDRAFVTNMAIDPTDRMLVRSAVDLGHSLGLRVVAEGVETMPALALLAAMRCDVAQGYLVARPMPVERLMDYLGDHRRAVLLSPPVEALAGAA
jgi:EAL domain-containing protein (putative c-di-GMP-specific phosphodiesterase class I)/GGDEF domain-containing protein